MAYEKELGLALRLARQAGRLALRYRTKKLRVRLKYGHSPVTAADHAAERLYVQGIRREFPHDRILGEEHGNRAGQPGRFWTVDPIDGTREFIRPGGKFSTMIGLVVGGQPVLGVISAPTEHKLYYAVRGEGAFVLTGSRRRKLRVRSRATKVSAATLNRSTNPKGERAYVSKLRGLAKSKRTISISGAGLILCAVAEGRLDAGLVPYVGMGIWDVVPGMVIITEAGGEVRDCRGQEFKPRWGSAAIRYGALSANKKLIAKLVAVLRRGKAEAILHAELLSRK